MHIISLSGVMKISRLKGFDFSKEKEILNVLVYTKKFSFECTEMHDFIDYEFGLMTDYKSIILEFNIVMICARKKFKAYYMKSCLYNPDAL